MTKYDSTKIHGLKSFFFSTGGIIAKLFFITLIGIGSLPLAFAVFPILRIFVHPKKKFKKISRYIISYSFRLCIFFMKMAGYVKIFCDDFKVLKSMKNKLIVMNHPSTLDYVILSSLMPGADCVVGKQYQKSFVGGVISSSLIVNDPDFESLEEKCMESMSTGTCLMIFPEGTRTPREGRNPYKKGAARVAKYCNVDIQPLLIAGSDKYGLQKHNPFFSFNTIEPLIYDIKILDEIHIDDYKNFSDAVSAKRLTDKIKKEIFEAADAYKKNHPRCITCNNI